MVRKKSGSRRQTLKDKYKIQKKVQEHKRKLRKQARLSGYKKKAKADPGVPNLWPFKDKIIAKLAKDKENAEVEKVKAKQQRNAFLKRMQRAQKATEDVEEKDELEVQAEQNYAKRRWYFKEMNKVIHMSDVIIEVVDARDPMGCRCKEIENRIQQMSAQEGSAKRIIIVMNKIDLVPPEVAAQWVKYLRKEFPTVAFKASTQQQGSRLSQAPVKLAKASEGLLTSAKCVGASTLMQLLKNYCRNRDVKTAINVGIIGYPNVGKSSIINSLKRSRVAGVGATPGFTKTISSIRLDKFVNMLDSPGVLFSPKCTQADLVLRNCIKLDQCEDPVSAVQVIAEKCPMEQLMQLYKISAYNSPDEFISHVAHKRGKIKKGGVPDVMAASRTVLQDWTTGAIPYYTLPPKQATTVHDNKEIVAGWAKEFDLDAVDAAQSADLSQITRVGDSGLFVQMEASAPLQMESMASMDNEDDEDDEDNDEDDMADAEEVEDEEEEQEIRLNMKASKQSSTKAQANPLLPQDQQKRAMKKQQKKASKQKKREGKAAQEVTESGGAGMEDEDYNFATDFV